jgi:hypothetical protein
MTAIQPSEVNKPVAKIAVREQNGLGKARATCCRNPGWRRKTDAKRNDLACVVHQTA